MCRLLTEDKIELLFGTDLRGLYGFEYRSNQAKEFCSDLCREYVIVFAMEYRFAKQDCLRVSLWLFSIDKNIADTTDFRSLSIQLYSDFGTLWAKLEILSRHKHALHYLPRHET